jgi:hypothetical protein
MNTKWVFAFLFTPSWDLRRKFQETSSNYIFEYVCLLYALFIVIFINHLDGTYSESREEPLLNETSKEFDCKGKMMNAIVD